MTHNFGKNQHLSSVVTRRSQVTGTSHTVEEPEFKTWDELSQDVLGGAFTRAFEWLPGVVLFIKDRQRRFVYFSSNFPEMMGHSAAHLIGKRDEELSPEYLVDHYRGDDNAVLTSGIELTDIAELVRTSAGGYDWNITSKWPIFNSSGEIVAVGGITRHLSERETDHDKYRLLTPAIEMMVKDTSRMVPLAELAAQVSLSPSQFGRTFKGRFGTTPQEYQRKIRMDAACDLLINTDLPIPEIAGTCGYFDQSHMTNDFRRRKGMPPMSYRLRYRLPGSGPG